MKRKLLYCTIPVDVYCDFWTNDAVTNKGQVPGPPGPTIPYEDRMGVDKDLELLNWKSKGYEYQGAAAAHQKRTNANLSETTQDIDAKEKGRKHNSKAGRREPQTKTGERGTWAPIRRSLHQRQLQHGRKA